MKRRYSPYSLPRWLRTFRGVCAQFAIPFSVFQGIRTLIFPTTLDILLLIILILAAIAFYFEVI